MFFLRYLIFFFFVLSGCQQKVLYLYQMKMDPSYLASTNVGSPDYRKAPQGQMVIAEWMLPKWMFDQDPVLRIHILFRNFTETCVEYPISSRVGYETYLLINDEFKEKEGFLAYRAEIITADGTVEAEWTHQLWVKLIDASEIRSPNLSH